MTPPVSRAVLVTGCVTGIGRATAQHVVDHGWTVYATARRLHDIAALEKSGAMTLELDVIHGLVRMCQLVLPGMRDQGWGRIVNLSSMGGRMSLPGGGLYHGTKHAVEAINDVLRYEVRPVGVRVVLVEPRAGHHQLRGQLHRQA